MFFECYLTSKKMYIIKLDGKFYNTLLNSKFEILYIKLHIL